MTDPTARCCVTLRPGARARGPGGAARLGLALGLTAALLATAPRAQAAPDDPPPPARHERLCDFAFTGRYQVFVAGRPAAEAAVSYSREGDALLVQNTAYGAPFLIDLKTEVVSRVRSEDLLRRPERDRYDLRAGAVLEPVARLKRQGGDLLVDGEGLVARLNLRTLGELSGQDVLDLFPEYRRDLDSYPVDGRLIEQLSRLEQGAEVVVYFGGWCHTCKRLLGRVLRVEQELADTSIRFRYYSLPRPPEMFRDEAVRQNNVRKLPTGTVQVGERAAGSIVSLAWTRPESALFQILARQGS